MEHNIATIDGFKSKATEMMRDNGFAPDKIMREISFALQHFTKNEYLNSATPLSKLRAVVNISQVGLTLNPIAKEAYLVPRYVNKQVEAVLEPSYVGLVKLLTDAGSVKSILCNVVFENDSFELNIADTANPVYHKPQLISSKKGNVLGCYALATLTNGSKQVEWMDVEQINEIRERSESYKSFKAGKARSTIWESDYSEMCRKTVIKRIYKYLPRTQKMDAVDAAISLSNQDYEITEEQREFIEVLMGKLHYSDEQIKFMRIEMNTMSSDRASKVIEQLKTDADFYGKNPDFNTRQNQGNVLSHMEKLS